MAKQSNYEVEDFLLNESFIEWILNDSEKEATFWNAWITAHPGCLPAMNAARKILLALHVKPSRQLTDHEIDLIINQLQQRSLHVNENFKIKLPSKINMPVFALRLAALLIIFISIGYLFFKQHTFDTGKTANYVKQVINNTKGTLLIKLADQSLIILKPGAQIQYSTKFNGKTREVSLNGEAFFEIHKDASHPFFVHSGDWLTRVVGTSFTIKASDKTKDFKVIVNTGKVLVYENNLTDPKTSLKNKRAAIKPIYLTPNQELVYNTTYKSLVKENLVTPLLLSADSSKELFTFHETPLDKVIANIRRAYNVNITYNKKQMGGCPITASLADEHLLEKLDLICKVFDAHYIITDGQIIILGEGCNSK
jgi:transmembrane sensor